MTTRILVFEAHDLQWQSEEVEIFCDRLRAAFRDQKLHSYQWV